MISLTMAGGGCENLRTMFASWAVEALALIERDILDSQQRLESDYDFRTTVLWGILFLWRPQGKPRKVL